MPPLRNTSTAALVAFVMVMAGCAAGGSRASASRASNVISLEEIEASSATNAWDLITQIRPNWLRGRGPSSLRAGGTVLPVVYVRSTRQGSAETLRGFATLTLLELRFVDAPTATTRYGNGHSGGVIEVTLRRR